MSSAKPRPPWITAPLFFGLFFGGGYLGIRLANAVAPGSGVAEFVSFLAFPAAFIVGIVAWLGASIPAALRRLAALRRGAPRGAATIPPGAFAFVPAALVSCAPAGAMVGIVAPDLGAGWGLGLYAGVGLAYGAVCWSLARAGLLPFPRD
ncbi:MAG: hypothetical protein R3357_06850 [Burkholderiales bacterium]|nr:hypothetical protein [Burkholderiales bacterium]